MTTGPLPSLSPSSAGSLPTSQRRAPSAGDVDVSGFAEYFSEEPLASRPGPVASAGVGVGAAVALSAFAGGGQFAALEEMPDDRGPVSDDLLQSQAFVAGLGFGPAMMPIGLNGLEPQLGSADPAMPNLGTPQGLPMPGASVRTDKDMSLLPVPDQGSESAGNVVPRLLDTGEVVSLASAAFHEPTGRPARAPTGGLGGAAGVADEVEPQPTGDRRKASEVRSRTNVEFDLNAALEVGQWAAGGGQDRSAAQKNSNTAAIVPSAPAPAKAEGLPADAGMARDMAVTNQVMSAIRSLLDTETMADDKFANAVPESTFVYQPKLRVLDIVLEPQDLGRVSIKMRLGGSGLSVTLEADSGMTRRLLQQESGALSDRLTAEGYDVESLSVQQLFTTASTSAKESTALGAADASRGAETSVLDPGAGDQRQQGNDRQAPRHRQPAASFDAAGPAEATEMSTEVRKHIYV